MALSTDAVMVLFCDVASDPAGHDDWHTYEHMHERLSIPGFIRGSRWLRNGDGPRYLIVYEVESVAMAESPSYLARLNEPTPWTTATMQRLRGMVRGFCHVTASAGYGLGRTAFAMRYAAADPDAARAWLARQAEAIASCRGVAAAHVLDPAGSPQMTREQAIRGKDAVLAPMLFVTGHDSGRLRAACERHLGNESLKRQGIEALDAGQYDLSFTATAAEVARTPKRPALEPAERDRDDPRSPGCR